jgi:hypothetical protein
MDALVGLINKCGQPLPPELGEGVFRAVSITAWNKEIISLDIVAHDHRNPRKECERLRKKLMGLGWVKVRDGLVWIPIGP